MGYTTDFAGRFELDKPLAPKMKKFLTLLNETRRMKRNVDEAFGYDGEFLYSVQEVTDKTMIIVLLILTNNLAHSLAYGVNGHRMKTVQLSSGMVEKSFILTTNGCFILLPKYLHQTVTH